MTRFIPLFFFAALLAAGCTQTFEADVARFHSLDGGDAGTIRIAAKDPARQNSLEFRQYAGYVRAELQGEGFRAVSGDPDLRVLMDWTVSEGRERIYSRPGYYGVHPFHYRAGFFHGFHGFGFHHRSSYGGYYGGSRVYSQTVRTVTLEIEMVRLGGESVFEGRAATTLSGAPDLPAVMPYLAQALFADFPGESGRARRVELELPDDAGVDAGY